MFLKSEEKKESESTSADITMKYFHSLRDIDANVSEEFEKLQKKYPHPDMSVCNPETGDYILHTIVKSFFRTESRVQFAIQNGADVNAKNKDGLIPAMLASYPSESLLKDLTPHNTMRIFPNGETLATHYVKNGMFFNGKIEVIQELAKYGIDVIREDAQGQTPFGLVFENAILGGTIIYRPSLADTKKLISEMQKRNARFSFTETAQFLAHPKITPEIVDALETARLFQFKGQDRNGQTLLHLFATNEAYFRFKEVIKKNLSAEVNTLNSTGDTPLMAVARIEEIEKDEETLFGRYHRSFNLRAQMKFLLEMGADVSFQDEEGNTVLHILAENDNAYMINYIMQRHPELNNIANKEGLKPVDMAKDTKPLLIETSPMMTQTMQAFSKLSEMEQVRFLTILSGLASQSFDQATLFAEKGIHIVQKAEPILQKGANVRQNG